MKNKQKIFGVFCVVTCLALIAGTILIANSVPVTDEPIGFRPGGAGPVTDEPIGDFKPGGAGPVTDEPIGYLPGGAGPVTDEPIGSYCGIAGSG